MDPNKKTNYAICSNVEDLGIIRVRKVSQTKMNIIGYCLYVEAKKNDTNELIYKTDSQSYRTNSWLPGGKSWKRDRLGSLGLIGTHCYIYSTKMWLYLCCYI